MKRRMLLTMALLALMVGPLLAAEPGSGGGAGGGADRPNFVVIFCDDLGYGDLGVFGHPTIQTPHLDRMAQEGQKWTQFYSASPICTPSRAALLTGRYPERSGVAGNVFFPDSAGGLPDSEVTIAETLKRADYATAAIGKWHLGHLPEHLPTTQGFDYYFGIPYSNDMTRHSGPSYPKLARKDPDYEPNSEYYNLPLMRGEKVIERPVDQNTVVKRYTEEAVKFIREHKDEPFFVYLAHNMVHIPLFASDRFQGDSRRGLYGDVMAEIDWSVGRVLQTLREQGLAENTLVVFSSDNGPWLTYDTHGGSAGLLRGGKNTTWEGGMRVPTIFWWPGHLEKGPVAELGSTLDLLPTFASLAGVELPDDRTLDGYDLTPVLLGEGESPRSTMIFHSRGELRAARMGPWKAHFITTDKGYGGGRNKQKHDPPLLFHLDTDPSEKYNVAKDHPEVIARIRELVERHKQTVEPVENQFKKKIKD